MLISLQYLLVVAISFSGYPENYRRTRFEEERTRIGDHLQNKDFPAVLAFEALLDSALVLSPAAQLG
ncbi:hypothetical protein [Nostoc sp. FACHB-888]|uniref:hypothetical protein n=1 Tax=Nostoc sp. FACHB-888 TaxID=2692842 RepID=UPI001688959C|nr:hypothetical protein [Nostoc sp. FACHB-888]MBD2249478.1 hypothetical protein [Nostoc sp. FACHB-888]